MCATSWVLGVAVPSQQGNGELSLNSRWGEAGRCFTLFPLEQNWMDDVKVQQLGHSWEFKGFLPGYWGKG